MAFSENNAKEKDLKELVTQNFPTCFVKSNRPYNKGAMLIDTRSGRILAQAETNFGLLEKLTRPGFSVDVPAGFLAEDEISDFEHVYKSELRKLEDSINDSYLAAQEWACGKDIQLVYDYDSKRFYFYQDGEAIVKRNIRPVKKTKGPEGIEVNPCKVCGKPSIGYTREVKRVDDPLYNPSPIQLFEPGAFHFYCADHFPK